MAGMFHENVEVFNSTTGTPKERILEVIFDGQRASIPVGKSMLPKVCVPYAKSQNVVMGSENAIDPSAFESLIAVVGKDDVTPVVEDAKELSRVRLRDIVGEGVQILVRGKVVPGAFDAGIHMPGDAGVFEKH